jgi:hypothetical protein
MRHGDADERHACRDAQAVHRHLTVVAARDDSLVCIVAARKPDAGRVALVVAGNDRDVVRSVIAGVVVEPTARGDVLADSDRVRVEQVFPEVQEIGLVR